MPIESNMVGSEYQGAGEVEVVIVRDMSYSVQQPGGGRERQGDGVGGGVYGRFVRMREEPCICFQFER